MTKSLFLSLTFISFLVCCYRFFFSEEVKKKKKAFKRVSTEHQVHQIPLKGVNYQVEVESIDNEVTVP